MSSNTSRIIYHDRFDGNGFTNENSLANMMLTKPDKINPVITHLAGREDKKFPLTFLTEGQKGGTMPIEISDIQYEWDVIRRLRKSDAILSSTYISTDKPGLNGTPFYLTFETNWLKNQHTVIAPDGTAARIMAKPVNVGNNFQYRLRLINPDPATYVPFAMVGAGVRWSMEGGASVSQSYSMGNESNKVSPGKMKNQISVLRKSYEWGGNVANRAVEVKFNVAGKETNLWMTFERWQHMMDWKQVCEEHYWWSQYNRLPNGEIPLKDEDNGLPIPIGAGVVDQIPNNDTYAFLTASKIKNTVGDVLYGATDTAGMEIVLYTGLGGMEEFDRAMKDEMRGFTQIVGDKFVTGTGRNLVLGGFFTAYEHVDGYRVIVKHLPLLDFGARAENAPKHPSSGKPITSYEMFFVDQTTYDGIRNVRMVKEKGRGDITGIVRGMAATGLPGLDFSGTGSAEEIAHEQDKAAVHMLTSKGIMINRNDHCFRLSCDLN